MSDEIEAFFKLFFIILIPWAFHTLGLFEDVSYIKFIGVIMVFIYGGSSAVLLGLKMIIDTRDPIEQALDMINRIKHR